MTGESFQRQMLFTATKGLILPSKGLFVFNRCYDALLILRQ